MKKMVISLIIVAIFIMSSCGDVDSGNTGNTANTGNSGDTGDTGNSGNSGDSGDTGNTGNSGDSGNSGDTGNTGNSDDGGNSGNSGDTGNTGNTGDTGNSGNSGNSGNTGENLIKQWTRQWGTSSNDHAQSIAIDFSGNIFVTGYTSGNLDENTKAGGTDIFLTKWNSNGTKAWTKQWGTSENDYGNSVAIDDLGNIFVAGYTYGGLDGNPNAIFDDIFLTKWNSNGTKAWTKQWGTTDYDAGRSTTIDYLGNIYITGGTNGSLDGNTKAGGTDIFLTSWNSIGTKAWTKQWGTSKNEYGNSVAIDDLGNIFVAGITEGGLDGNLGPGLGFNNIFLTKWNSDGTKAWTKQWGTGSEGDPVMAVDSTGNIFVAGSTDGRLDGNTNAGSWDIFLTKWNSDGTKAWTRQWGTSSRDYGNSVVIDNSGNIFVVGATGGHLDGNISAGDMDIFVTKWNLDGTKAWSKQWGTDGSDYGNSVAIDDSGNMFITGYSSGDFDGNTNAGFTDIFLTKWTIVD